MSARTETEKVRDALAERRVSPVICGKPYRTEVVDLPKSGRQVMEFDADRNLVAVNGIAVRGVA
jgi:hypothetical protein